MTAERWKAVPGYEGRYEVSDHGRVRSVPRPRTKGGILSPAARTLAGNGQTHAPYYHVGLYMPGKKRKFFYIHRLVLMAFSRLPTDEEDADHVDGDTENNHLSNLRWMPMSKNRSGLEYPEWSRQKEREEQDAIREEKWLPDNREVDGVPF